ncbi:MAG: hypothetical protein ACRD4Q_01710 [Candidatus Acidiferrales bacterium]
MPAPQSFDNAFLQEPMALQMANETAIITSPEVPSPLPASHVVVRVTCIINAGANTASYIFRLRQGAGIGGQIVQTWPTIDGAVAANIQTLFPLEVRLDSYGTDFVQYTLTVTANGATANGTVNMASITVTTF